MTISTFLAGISSAGKKRAIQKDKDKKVYRNVLQKLLSIFKFKMK